MCLFSFVFSYLGLFIYSSPRGMHQIAVTMWPQTIKIWLLLPQLNFKVYIKTMVKTGIVFKKRFVFIFLSSFFHLKYEEVILIIWSQNFTNRILSQAGRKKLVEVLPNPDRLRRGKEERALREWETCPNLACASQNYKEENEVDVMEGRESSG